MLFSVFDLKSVLVGALGVAFLAFFTGPFNIRHGSQGGSWVENVFDVQLGGTVELVLFLAIVGVIVRYKLYEWIPSRGEARPWIAEE